MHIGRRNKTLKFIASTSNSSFGYMGNKTLLRSLQLSNEIIDKLFNETSGIQCYNTVATCYGN